MTMIEPMADQSDADLAVAASLFRSLGDSSRLAIMRLLLTGEHNVRELTDHLGLAQSTVSAHLRCLLDCQMVTVRAQGRSSVYAAKVGPKLGRLLQAAEELLYATGAAVALCPTYGTDQAPSRTTGTGPVSTPARQHSGRRVSGRSVS